MIQAVSEAKALYPDLEMICARYEGDLASFMLRWAYADGFPGVVATQPWTEMEHGDHAVGGIFWGPRLFSGPTYVIWVTALPVPLLRQVFVATSILAHPAGELEQITPPSEPSDR
jgi:hypothetical protein